MPTTWNMGATRNARNAVKLMKPPRVSVPARIWRAPTYITVAPTMPISNVAERLISEMAVSDFSTLSSRRCTPPENTLRLLRLGVVALHHAHAGQRFRQPARYFGVDFAALAENRPDTLKAWLRTSGEDAR